MMMQIICEIISLRKQILQWRREGLSIAFVPTKGDIHEGHLALIREAAKQADIVVVSIFVNQLEQHDIDNHHLKAEQDITTLKEMGVTLLFTPTINEMVPTQIDQHAHIHVPHFHTLFFEENQQHSNFLRLFTTNICKLFNLVQPDIVCVGETDIQRVAIIQKLVDDLCYPIKIIAVPTVREIDGLVASRQNKKLTVDERQRAPVLAKTLRWASGQIRGGRRDFNELLLDCQDQLRAAGLIPDEIWIRDADTFQTLQEKSEKIMLFASVKLSQTRLIDHLILDILLTTNTKQPVEEEKHEIK